MAVDKTFPSLAGIHTVAFDFDGVFTDNKVWVDQDGRESVCCDRGDGLAFDMVRAFQKQGLIDVECFILTKETNPVVLSRAAKLGLICHHGVGDKLGFMKTYFASRFPDSPDPFAGLIYLGNDLNDLPLLRRAGYGVSPADAHPRIQDVADLVLPRRGGDGFVRAFIERLLEIHELTEDEVDKLICNC